MLARLGTISLLETLGRVEELLGTLVALQCAAISGQLAWVLVQKCTSLALISHCHSAATSLQLWSLVIVVHARLVKSL